MRKGSKELDEDPNAYIAVSNRCAHLGCPVRFVEAAGNFICPCHGGVYDFVRANVLGGPPVRPLDQFQVRTRGGQVELGPRYSVTSQLEPVRARDPGEFTGGIWEYLYPPRPSTFPARAAMSKLDKLDKLVPAPLRKPAKPGSNGAKGEAPADLKTSPPERQGHAARLVDQAKEAPIDALAWVDQRTAASGFLTGMLFRKVPKGTNWFYTLGSATLFAFIVQAVTGVFLAMFYTPSTTQAYASIAHINNDVFLGAFVHGMHKWGSSVMVILIFLHMGRTFFFGAYKYPRELNWVIGVVLLILTMTMSFTGYLLPFDQRSFWASVVGININGTGPIVGPYLSDFLRAGPELGATTLSRFYAIHMLLLPGRDHRPDRRPHVPGRQARHDGAALDARREAEERRSRPPSSTPGSSGNGSSPSNGASASA